MSPGKLKGTPNISEFHKKCFPVSSVILDSQKLKNAEHPRRAEKDDGKERVRYVNTDGEQVLIVSSNRTNYYPIKLDQKEMDRLKAKAVVLTEKDKMRMVEEARAERARLELESAFRKNELKEYDKKIQAGGVGRLSELEREAKEKANYLLRRAWELRHEEEDDVKKANSLILQIKCQAIRDAQLKEAQLIQKEIKEEERRLERMVDDQRLRLLKEDKIKLEEERSKKNRYVRELNAQMEEIQARRLFEAEQLIEERKKTNEALFAIILEDLETVKQQEEEKRKTSEFLRLGNEALKNAQAMEREEERLADLRCQEYMRLKGEREEKYEQEKLAEKKWKEIEYARQRALQERQADLQAIQDEMNAVRRQEEYERNWRKKEKEAMKKRLKMEEDCQQARQQQILDTHKFQALEIAREKREFEKNLKFQMERQERERLLELKRQYEAECYREDILKQINRKERQRIEERQEKFEEGLALKAEDAKRRHEMIQILDTKIDGLRQSNVPEKYIFEIRRQLNI